MKVAIIGSGYVGLVSGACLARIGHQVVCIDRHRGRIDALNNGHVPIFEPGLDDLMRATMHEGRLSFASGLAKPVREADVVIIAVGTPPRAGDGYADLTQVYDAVRTLAPYLNGFTVIAVKSTVPIGTGDEIERMISELRPDADVAVVSNPEFLREGAAISDFMHPDRIVIGASDRRAQEVMTALYAALGSDAPIVSTNRATSELLKYASNAFLAAKITFINELADLCEHVGAEVGDVARGMGLDARIGPQFLRPGPGFGGSCFPKDTLSLVKAAQDHGVTLRIVEAVASANDIRRRAMVRKIARITGGGIRGKRVAVLGLTFKPDTDDVRDSPAISLITRLFDGGAKVRAYDPAGMANASAILPALECAEDPYACAKGADVLVFATEWAQFRTLDLSRLRDCLARPAIVDLRNIFDPEEMMRQGFVYDSIGRGSVRAPLPADIAHHDVAELVA
jgi:UDPglucose 6-dehydrogenase